MWLPVGYSHLGGRPCLKNSEYYTVYFTTTGKYTLLQIATGALALADSGLLAAASTAVLVNTPPRNGVLNTPVTVM
jgi:hypothetical protein